MIAGPPHSKREQNVADVAQTRLVPNVVAGWLAHGVAVVVGFVMPRLIDESVGQAALGVWDLGWSLTSYIAFTGLGLGMAAAITHDVARFSRSGSERLRGSIATGFYCQGGFALGMGLALATLFFGLPVWAPATFGSVSSDMQAVGTYLALVVVVGLIGDFAQGILTGYHRTSWNEYLTIGADVALAVSMIAVLLAGGGIVGLAKVTLLIRIASEAARFTLAWVICPTLSVNPRLWRWSAARRLSRYATKSSLGVLHEVVGQQGVRVLLAVGAGPAALACYSRYQTIIRQITRLMERSTRVIPPITSDLAWQARQQEIDRFRERASKATVMASLPLIGIFAVFGNELVEFWMGPDFVVPGISWILALMAVIHVDYGVSSRILSGMNAHGRIAALCFGASLVIFVISYLALRPLTALDAAWMAALVMGLGVSLPHYFLSCARLGTPPWRYFKSVYLPALVANALFVAGLIGVRALALDGEWGWAVGVGVLSPSLLFAVYWHFGLSPERRESAIRMLRARINA